MRRPRSRASEGPSHLDALALAAEAADEIVVGTVRDVHDAVAGRVHAAYDRVAGGGPSTVRVLHEGIAAGVFTAISGSLRLGSAGLRLASAHGVSAGEVDHSATGRALRGVVNGLMGDRLREEGHPMALEATLRTVRDGRGSVVRPDAAGLRAAYPDAGEQVVVFVHGLCETEDVWWHAPVPASGSSSGPSSGPDTDAEPVRSYGDRLTEDGWTPVYVRLNTGLPVADNAVALSALLHRLVEHWPVPVARLALVGHSMGGLVVRAAGAVSSAVEPGWTDRVTDVVCLGTPHLGAPLERVVARGVRLLDRLPEAAPFGRILELRSVGILDLRHGLSRDVQNLPHARYRLVGATLARRPDGPGAGSLGDLLVPFASAMGREPDGAGGVTEMFPGAATLHVRGDHFDLLNHVEVLAALRGWLADRDDAPTREDAGAARDVPA